MELSSAFCRTQAACQRERAAGSPLENVRILAGNAAKVWDQAAVLAEGREAMRERRQTIANLTALYNAQPPQDADEAP